MGAHENRIVGVTNASFSMNRGMRDVLLAWGFLFTSTCGVCILFGTPLESALRYLAYQIAFAILPGVPIYALAARRTETPIAFATKVVVVGQCFEMTAGLLLTMLGWHAIYPMLPFVCMAAVWLARKQIRRAIESRETPLEVMVCWALRSFWCLPLRCPISMKSPISISPG